MNLLYLSSIIIVSTIINTWPILCPLFPIHSSLPPKLMAFFKKKKKKTFKLSFNFRFSEKWLNWYRVSIYPSPVPLSVNKLQNHSVIASTEKLLLFFCKKNCTIFVLLCYMQIDPFEGTITIKHHPPLAFCNSL